MKTIPKKVVLLGSFGVGKTSLVSQFVHQKFSEQYLTTIGVKIDKKEVDVDGQHIQLILWDIAGETSTSKIAQSYLTGAHGAIYVFDVTREETYANLESELNDLFKMLLGAPIEVIGNKIDLLEDDTIEELNTKFSLDVTFTSAKTGVHVDEVFQRIAQKML